MSPSSFLFGMTFGDVYKPRGQMKGRDFAHMTKIFDNSYLVKIVFIEGKGIKIAQNSVLVVCTRTLLLTTHTLETSSIHSGAVTGLADWIAVLGRVTSSIKKIFCVNS